MALQFAYIAYLAAATLLGAVACSRDKDSPSTQTSDPQEPTPPQPVLRVKKGDPAYPVYEKLAEAGLTDREIDGVKEGPNSSWPPSPPLQVLIKTHSIGHPSHRRGDGQITELDLFYTGNYFFMTVLSPEANKKWQGIFQEKFKETGDRYVKIAEQKSGLALPQACGSVEEFKKASLWDGKNARAQYIVGVCQSEPKRLFQALQADGNFKEAKEALETFYRQRTRKDPNDATAWMNLGYALKVQGKLEEAKETFLYARAINPKLVTTHFELREIYSVLGDPIGSDLEARLAHSCPRLGGASIGGAMVRVERGGVEVEGKFPGSKRRVALWHGPYTGEMLKRDEEYWQACRR